jgi:hypothetical protein
MVWQYESTPYKAGYFLFHRYKLWLNNAIIVVQKDGEAIPYGYG